MKKKEIIKDILKGYSYRQCLLFGSRARGDYTESSDYDLLLIVDDEIGPKQRLAMAHLLREKFAECLIDADIIIKSVSEAAYFRNKVGSVLQNALEEGVAV